MPVTVTLTSDGLKGCFPDALAERGALSRFLSGLDKTLALRLPSAFEAELQHRVQSLTTDRIVDFELRRGPKGFEVAVHRASENVAKGLTDLADAALAQLHAVKPPLDVKAPFTRDTILELLGENDQQMVYILMQALERLELTEDPQLGVALGLTSDEVEALFDDRPVTTGRGPMPVVVGLLRHMGSVTGDTIDAWKQNVPFSSAEIYARATALAPPPEVAQDVHPAFAQVLACLSPADAALAMGIIRARVYTKELEDTNFESAIGMKRDVVKTILESPRPLTRTPPVQLVQKLLKIDSVKPLPEAWWRYSTLDRAGAKELFTRWSSAVKATALAAPETPVEKPHRINAANVFASVPMRDVPIVNECLSALEASGFRPDKWACPGILGISSDDLAQLLAGGSIRSSVTAEQFLSRTLTYIAEREVLDNQWSATMSVSQGQVRDAARRYREQHRDKL
jgi:hypothetical protein